MSVFWFYFYIVNVYFLYKSWVNNALDEEAELGMENVNVSFHYWFPIHYDGLLTEKREKVVRDV